MDSDFPGIALFLVDIRGLETKALVHRDRSLSVHLFTAAVDRGALVGRCLDAMVAKLCGGSLTPVISHLLGNPKLSAEERRQLRAMAESPKRAH